MVRTILIAALAAAFLAAPAVAADRTVLMPGVTYERQVEFTSHGPVAIHVLTAPKPGGLWSVKPVLSNNAILGTERVTAMQREQARSATVAGVNGDLFAWADGRPSGVLLRDGVLTTPPSPDRSSIGFAGDGTLRVERVRSFGTWRGNGQRRPVSLNASPGPNGISLLTPAWGPSTPVLPGSVEAVLLPFPATRPNVDLQGPVIEVRSGGGGPIPVDGAVLVARGSAAQRLTAEAPVGSIVTTRVLLTPDWAGVTDAIGGGPLLVRDGRPIFRHFELFSPEQLARNPRTAVGQLADGRIVLVVVDGRQPGYSVGMTNFELALTLVRLGAVVGSGLDAGGSSTMAFDGTLLNRPSDPDGERPVSEGLFVLYGGVYVAPPTEEVLSPNGDGVAESQTLGYKLPRPATVTVTLIGPDNVSRTLELGPKVAGSYRLPWTGLRDDGSPELEGAWRFGVSAVDDAGKSSTANRTFSLNQTLGGLSVAPPLLRVRPNGPALRAQFTLSRPAAVTASVETTNGAVFAVVAQKRLAAGAQTLTWNGTLGRATLAHSGSYVLRIAAANELGRSELVTPFAIRRVAGPPRPGPARTARRG